MAEPAGGRATSLTGWGRTSPSTARLLPGTPEELPGIITGAGARGVIARGLGRSYGDAAQNAGGDVIGPLPSRIDLDADADGGPVVHASAGASLHELIRVLVPTGHFVPVTPGTRYVTIGGAIAADVHGKNHHRHGSFGSHVVSLDLLTADGSVRTIGPDQEGELFWATVGGMGLTGVILDAVVRVHRVESGLMRVQTERLDDIDAVMARMREADREATHSVAWIDTLATGRHLGRSVLTLGEHATADEVGSARTRWRLPGAPVTSAPTMVPPHLISRPTTLAFNELWFRKAPRHREKEIQSLAAFFHPLDMVGAWNRLYGPAGFVQYQLVLPDSAEGELPRMLEHIARAGHPSFLSVLKRFGPGNCGMLSFPMQGWTLAIDVPTHARLASLLRQLDTVVADSGGRVYLAKDSRLSPAAFARMYPRLEDFRRVLAEVNPNGVFCSDLSRRLQI
jgi:decaprenylphospho-beta-D-ribofuranose 2-oxidase